MQYTNNILDLLVTIGFNIQSTIAYRSTGMELRVFSTQVQCDNMIKQRASFCSSFYLTRDVRNELLSVLFLDIHVGHDKN